MILFKLLGYHYLVNPTQNDVCGMKNINSGSLFLRICVEENGTANALQMGLCLYRENIHIPQGI